MGKTDVKDKAESGATEEQVEADETHSKKRKHEVPTEAKQEDKAEAADEGNKEAADVQHEDAGKKAASKTESSDQQPAETPIEEGHVYFFYRPRVDVDHPKALRDVQRFEMIMKPTSGGKARLIIIGKKRLPDPARHERFFGYVEAVADDVKSLTADLGEQHYDTKTKGERTVQAARAVGEGAYVIARGGSKKATHLAYKLEVPDKPGEAQEVFKIKEQGSFVISIKASIWNPENKRPGAPSAGPEPQYSEPQRKRFKGYSWIDVDDPSMLEVEGTELLLVGAKDDPIPLVCCPPSILLLSSSSASGELGGAGDALEEVYESDTEDISRDDQAGGKKDKTKAMEDKIKQAIEPNNTTLPVEPAVTGKLI
eukprot:jgi/Chrzof1/837/Cz01g30210.t1